MKKSLLLFSLFNCCFAFTIQAQWTSTIVNKNYFLQKTFFVNDSMGFAVGQKKFGNGIILKTTNRGMSWDSTIIDYPVNSVYFPNKFIGYAGTWKKMYKTINSGNSWTELAYDFIGFDCKGLFFLNNDTGYFANGGGYNIYKTEDGGNTWASKYFGPNPAVIDEIYFFDKDTGFIAGWYGPKLAKTTDGGTTWQDINNVYNIDGLKFISKMIAYAVGSDTSTNPVIIKSYDGGSTWNVIHLRNFSGSSSFFSSIFCIDENTCYVVGDSGTILKTIDGGNNWVQQISGTNKKLNSVYCIDDNTCFAVGDSGIILRTTNGGVGIIEASNSSILLSLYPNPLTSSSTLQLNTQLKDADVIIYDMLGKEMLRKKLTGDRMEIERGSLESGVYFVRVQSEERQSAGGRIRWGEWVEKVVVE